jgi:hypothetical protein
VGHVGETEQPGRVRVDSLLRVGSRWRVRHCNCVFHKGPVVLAPEDLRIQRGPFTDGRSAVPDAERERSMGALPGDADGRRNGEEDTGSGQEHEANSAISQYHSRLVDKFQSPRNAFNNRYNNIIKQ